MQNLFKPTIQPDGVSLFFTTQLEQDIDILSQTNLVLLEKSWSLAPLHVSATKPSR